MAERSAAALHWLAVTLVLWGLTRLTPPTGCRRKPPTPSRTAATSKNATGRPVDPAVRVPTVRRSPYSTDRGLLDGAASRLSRPYLPAVMDAAPEPKPRRRTVTVPAADFGIDAYTWDIHSELTAVSAR
ncbi:hypothetical protein AB0945_06850 [Streptomyces sp. NPDC005474]|uniref:hypothetical protein n=1 Tax=Streptomyces sp. NPDC005474 TaxID=3154878 RepID=UPI003455E6DE